MGSHLGVGDRLVFNLLWCNFTSRPTRQNLSANFAAKAELGTSTWSTTMAVANNPLQMRGEFKQIDFQSAVDVLGQPEAQNQATTHPPQGVAGSATSKHHCAWKSETG